MPPPIWADEEGRPLSTRPRGRQRARVVQGALLADHRALQARAPPEDREADRRGAASARRGAGAATAIAMVPAANHRTVGPRLSRRSGDACVPRDDLSIALCAEARSEEHTS